MNILEKIFSIPKTIYFNFKVLKFRQAILLPFLVSYKTKFGSLYKNVIEFERFKPKFFKIKLGIGGSEHVMSNRYSRISFGRNSKIIFTGNTFICDGFSIRCDNGTINIGKDFHANKNMLINCEKNIKIGDNCTFGVNVNLRDSDGHTIVVKGIEKNNKKSITIGNHVWICSNVDILKGSKISDNSVVALRSVVLKKFEDANCLIGGYLAKVLQNNINWIK